MKRGIVNIFSFAKKVILEFFDDNVLKYSASLSYYTVFSLAPMIIIIITICGQVFGKEATQGKVYMELKDMVGSEAALQIQDIIKNIHLTKDTPVATIVGIVVFLLGGTAIFG